MAKQSVSVQKATNQPPQVGGITLPLSFFAASDIAPEWDSVDRDTFLRSFWKRFGADMLQGVIATVVAKVQTQNWELEGPKRLVSMYHQMIRDDSDFNRGYDSLVSRGLQDYYTQDRGWFMERLRSGPDDREGPCLGLAHLDAQRMKPTGNNEYPWAYEDVEGQYHLMHRSQYIRIVDLPTPATQLYSDERGFCALSRSLSTATILIMLAAMKREKLADLPPSALAIFNNISRKQFENSIRLHGAQDDMKNNMLWRQLMPLFGIDPAHEARVQFISLREVWESYDDQTAMDIAAYSFAAGFRIDPREFWPVSQGPLGTGKEAEVQHQKAKAKAHGLLFTQIERNWNSSNTLPDRVTFRFVIQDIDEEEQRAKIHSSQISNVEGMQKAGAALTPQEVRYLLCKQYKILPKVLLNPPQEGEEVNFDLADVYMDDVERQAKEFGGWYFGPVVKMLDDGTIIEPDYRSGLLGRGWKELGDGPLYIGDVVPPMIIMAEKGGPGSGNYGHAGRPGLVGGSGGSSSGSVLSLINNLPVYTGYTLEDDSVETPLTYDPQGAGVIRGASDKPVETTRLSLGELVATEPALSRDVLLKYAQKQSGWDDPIVVIAKGGKYYIQDGHHKAAAASFRGDKDVTAKVYSFRGSTKELTIQTLAKDFSCCSSHAAQEFPNLIDNLRDLGYMSTEESYAAELLLPENVFEIAAGLKETKQGDDLLMSFVRGLRRQLGLREILFGEKESKGLETINQKINNLPRPVANQVRQASSDLFKVMNGKDRQQAILDIPDEVWLEAERQDLLDEQPEVI